MGRMHQRRWRFWTRLFVPLSVGWLVAGIVWPAVAASVSPWTKAQEWLEQGQVERALSSLTAMEEQQAGEPGYDVVWGWALLAAGRMEQASFALERVLMVDPTQSQGHLLTAELYFRRGDLDRARNHLDQVRDSPLPPTLQQIRKNLTASLSAPTITPDGAATGNRRVASMQLGFGYDSNLTSGPNAAELLIPGIATTSTTSLGTLSRAGGWVTTIGGMGGISLPVAPGTQVMGAVSVSQNSVPRRPDREEGYGSGLLGVSYHTGQETFTVAATAQGHRLDHTLYRTYWSGLGHWRHQLSDTAAVNGYGQYLNDHYPDYSTYDIQRFVAGASHEMAVSPHLHVSWGGHGGRELAKDDSSPQVSKYLFGGEGGGKYRMSNTVIWSGTVGYERQNYDANDLFYLSQRRDQVWSLATTLDWAFSDPWHLTSTISYTDNHSSLSLYDYNRALFTLALRWDFTDGKP
ncbi:MAG: tetratricopeptide repeat protein [Magnetococcales bacterium]|nr:tetratricopeptide repeat protein [Magnetococcales bacterium]